MRNKLFFCLVVILLGACACFAQPPEPLLSQRMAAVQAFVLRASSPEALGLAYHLYAASNITHTVRDVGQFGPGIELALEYDSVLFIIGAAFGAPPVALRPSFDPTTVAWIDQDTIVVDYVLNASTLFDPTIGAYQINVDGLRYRDYFVFLPGTSRIVLDYGIQDPIGSLIFQINTDALTPEAICGGIIFPACNGPAGNYLNATGFTDIAHCVQFMYALKLGPQSPCPFPFMSNSAACRALHGFSSFPLPQVHCAHVPPQSHVCRDRCLPACAGCSLNAKCVADFPTLTTAVYKCECKPGYVGNGTDCVVQSCTASTDCAGNPNRASCPSEVGLCGCAPSFTWNPQTGECDCAGDSRVYSNGSAGPVCVPKGKCFERSQCPQNYDEVKCVQYGQNAFATLQSCLCNHGYQGGWEYPCSCPAPKREVYSRAHEGKICISSTECTEDRHCRTQSTGDALSCHIALGNTVGICA